MAGEWREVTLDHLGRIVTGKTPPSNGPECFGDDIPFVTPTDLDGRRIIDTTGRGLTEGGADSVSGSLIPAHAVMVSCIGSDMGKAAVAGRDCVTNQQINSIVLDTSDDPLFVYYNLSTRKSEIRSAAGGSAQPILNKSAFGRLDILLPPPDEQRAIAHILGTLDDKIELNRRMNETLETMARALFKSWFVDFDPVRAKHALSKVEGAEGCDPGLPKPVADLFPDVFADSELGDMPKGWAIGRFGDVVDQLRDQENPLASPDALFHHFSIPAFDEGQSPKPEYGESIKSLKSRVLAGVILLSKLNPDIERVWIVDVRPGERAVCSTEFLVLRALSPFTRSYVYCLARSPLFRQQIEGLVTGTSKSHQRAQVNSILNLAVVVPPSSIVAAFDHCADDLLARTLECRRESHALAALRDALLPKLISGELRVGDSGRFSKVT